MRNKFLSLLIPAIAMQSFAMEETPAAAASTGGAATDPATAPPVIPPGTATTKEFSFFFKTDKTRDDTGAVIGTGRKHPDVKGPLPIPTYAELSSFLQVGGKEAELILELVIDGIDKAARNQINDWRETNGLDKDFTVANFDLSKLSVTAIANTPKSERGGPSISDEDWTAFFGDYTEVMVKVVGYDQKKVALHVVHYKTLFRRIKNDKAAVQKLLDLLNVYASKTENLEDNMTCFEDLTKRATKYLKAEEKDVAAAL